VRLAGGTRPPFWSQAATDAHVATDGRDVVIIVQPQDAAKNGSGVTLSVTANRSDVSFLPGEFLGTRQSGAMCFRIGHILHGDDLSAAGADHCILTRLLMRVRDETSTPKTAAGYHGSRDASQPRSSTTPAPAAYPTNQKLCARLEVPASRRRPSLKRI
jgi:hypothetical protein